MRIGLLALLALMAAGCASGPEPVHNDREGWFERMARLQPAHTSATSAATLASSRDEASHPRRRGSFLGNRSIAGKSQQEMPSVSVEKIRDLSLCWPLAQVKVTSPFGQRGHSFHEGVDLRAPAGTLVYASHAGQVLYAGEKIRGYGKMIVIRHSSGIATIYAHNSKLLVHQGQWVTQGSRIARSGNTGHSHGAHLHFEIRSGVEAIDPAQVISHNNKGARVNHLIATK